jgi:hypothetical protein
MTDSKPNKRLGFALCLIFWVSAFGLLCCNPRFNVELSATPKAEVQPGGNLTINIRLTHPEPNLSFRWRANHGTCDPSMSESLTTIYTAAPKSSADDPPDDTVLLEVMKSGKIIRIENIQINILRGPTINWQPKPLAKNSNEKSPATPNTIAPSKPEQPVNGQVVISSKPSVRITLIPRYDPVGGDNSKDDIAGEALGVDPKDFLIVVYALTDRWYVQPFTESPFTQLNNNGSWNAMTHTGAQYAALLVRPSFNPPKAASSLPSIGGEVLAISTVKGVEK